MTRRRKFRFDDVVMRPAARYGFEQDLYAITVDHRVKHTVSYYYVLRSDPLGNTRGTGLWVKTDMLRPVLTKYGNPRRSPGTRKRWLYNKRLEEFGDRGCKCHCCGHRREDRRETL